jgi:hypothetical protein
MPPANAKKEPQSSQPDAGSLAAVQQAGRNDPPRRCVTRCVASGHGGDGGVRQRFDTAENDPAIHLAFAVKAKFPCYISHFVAVLID